MKVIDTDYLVEYNFPIVINKVTNQLLENLETNVMTHITDENPLADLNHLKSILIENALIRTYGINFDYKKEGLTLDSIHTDYSNGICQNNEILYFASIGKIEEDDEPQFKYENAELNEPDDWGLD